MRAVLLIALALALIGCSQQNTASSTAGTEGSTGARATETSSTGGSTNSGSTADSGSTAGSTGQSTPPSTPIHVPQGDNPNRVNQLRELKKIAVKANGHTLHLWVMDTNSKQSEGMMYLTEKDVKDDEGMIFVFATEQPRAFWMQNTILALDIIYLSKEGKVRNIQQGKPFDETSLPSEGPTLYVVELKQGCAKKFGIAKGTQFELPKGLKGVDEPRN